jgi:hypothetical protein
MHYFSASFGKELYMFRTDLVSIIRSLNTVCKALGICTQSRIVTGLLTGRNTLRRHLYIMGLSNNLICWKCGTEEETSFHILRDTYLGS